VQWTVLVPVKALPGAKSRLDASDDPAAHEALVSALRADTLTAARAADGVARVLVVSDRVATVPAGADELIVQSESGLNEALCEGADYARRRWPDDGVAALVGDLPALRSAELAESLARAGSSDRAFVPDQAGTGTTLLTARPGAELAPQFGHESAAKHRSGHAVPLEAGPGLRHDVDTRADLRAALSLGVGPATLAVTASGELRVHLGSA
jgi:2-phospho-L-lactate guanylyltransferase